MTKPFLQSLFEKLADKLEARVIFADEFGYAGYFQFKSGLRTFFKGTSFDINPQGASKIAADKDYCAKIMKRLGYSVPEGVLIFSPEYRSRFERSNPQLHSQLIGLEAAIETSGKWEFPLFVKPNDESEGLGVSRAYDVRQLVDDVQSLFSWSERVLVQKALIGNDFRLVLLDGELISAYQRRPLQIRGDGARSIRNLLDDKIAELQANGRGKRFQREDPRIWRELHRLGYDFEYVPEVDEVLRLLPNANLSTGGEATDLTDVVHESYKKYCSSIASDMNLRLCGIDLITDDLSRPMQTATVLELNSEPGLNNFAATGKRENVAVEKLYEKILTHLRDSA
jgi:D-alanine-D-alanine ligase-like ATP-grasp enzyme